MRELLRRRRLERDDVHAARVHLADDVPHRAALAGRVHALEHEQHAAGAAGPALRVELFLQRREPLGELGLAPRASALPPLNPGVARVSIAPRSSARRRTQQVGDLFPMCAG